MFKSKLRKRILKTRKIANKNNIKLKFDKIFKLIKKREPKKKSIIGGYFPINFEVDAWININKKGDFNEKHNHPNCHLAGVLWIKCPENCGDISFDSPVIYETHQEGKLQM